MRPVKIVVPRPGRFVVCSTFAMCSTFARCSISVAALLLSTCLAAAETDLPAAIRSVVAAHRGKIALAVRHLENGTEFGHEPDAVMPTASLIKLPVMVTAYRLADEGKLDLNRMLTLKAEDKVPGSGILTTHFSPGAQISVRDAIRLMIAYSDNTATNLVLDQIGLKTTAQTMEQLGYPNTKVHAKVFRGDTSVFPERSKQFGLGSTSPREMIALLTLLHQKQLASPVACEAMLEHLSACEDKDKLVRELPAGTKFAHKTGSVNAVRTDAGIMTTPAGPIAICVMTSDNEDKRWTRENAAEVVCGRIGRAVYDHFNRPGEVQAGKVPAVLTLGASGPLVEALQRTLNVRLKPSPELSVDGDFGAVTREAVIRFQAQAQLAVTGEVGPETWKALGPLLLEPTPVPDPEIVNREQLKQETESLSAPPLVTAKAWAVADAKTGILLWGSQEREKLHFASTTKVMTAYIVLKLAEQNPNVLAELVTFSRRADETVGSTADLRAGEQLPVGELLYGLMLPSGNDAAVALAEHFGARFGQSTGGSAENVDPLELFVEEMNRRAKLLGMRDTSYSNPHGLTAPGHQSTAADLIVLAHAARQLPRFRDYITTRQHGYCVTSSLGYSRNVLWKNTNKLLGIQGYDGVKTGTTEAAGACLVCSGQHERDELLVVVLGSASSDARYVDSRNLFRWAWNQRR